MDLMQEAFVGTNLFSGSAEKVNLSICDIWYTVNRIPFTTGEKHGLIMNGKAFITMSSEFR